MNAKHLLRSNRLRDTFFWSFAFLLIAGRLALTSDLSVQIHYAPIDDTLFVERAYALLTRGDFGPYDATTLSKYPGLSIWLAGLRALGLPLLLGTNVLYVLAGLYVVSGLLRHGLSRLIVGASLAIYLFDPITFGYEWIRPQREPLATILFVSMLGASIHMLLSLREARPAWSHLLLFSIFFAFALFVREDDRFLWFFWVLISGSLVWRSAALSNDIQRKTFATASVLLPLIAGFAYGHELRAFVADKYGSPILNEISEGEFPKLMAAIRSIDTKPDNRLVALTQDAAMQIRENVPSLRPIIERLPRPGPGTYSCIFQQVCSEWSNGYLPFWLREESQKAGVLPNLPQSQAYFLKARREIELACAEGRLRCTRRGEGLFPPFELRWTRAYVAEAWAIVRTALWPSNNPIGQSPVSFEIPIGIGRIYQVVTMTHHFDTAWQSSVVDRPATRILPLELGPHRQQIGGLVYPVAALLIALAALTWMARVWHMERLSASPLGTVGILLGVYWFAKFLALAYVATFMGAFAERLWFPFHASTVLLALPFAADFLHARRRGNSRETS